MATESGIPSQDTYANLKTPLSVINGGGQSTFSTITASSLSVTGELIATYIEAAQISSIFLESEEIACSTISTLSMVLDGNVLTSAGPELFLNGVALATTANLSSIGDWALDPAISTVNMNGNPIINSAGYTGSGTVSTTNIVADVGLIDNLVCRDISTITLTAFSTIQVISTISSLFVVADKATITDIVASDVSTNTLTVTSTVLVGDRVDSFKMFAAVANFGSTFTSSLVASTITVSSINGEVFPQVIPPQTVPSTLTGPDVYVLADQGLLGVATANANIRAQGGLGGNVNIRADPGTLGVSGGSIDLQAFGGNGTGGLFGAVRLTAYEGTDGTGFTTGGLIQLQANSGGALSNATSAIKFSGGSVVSYAGAANPVGSLYGYNYLYGTVGASITASVVPPTVNTPGTVYLYGDQGVVLGSDMYASRIFGYWNGLSAPSNLVLSGRQIPILGNSYVILSNVQNMYMDNGVISGVNTINGTSYPPPPFVPSANPELSTLTINPGGYISTPVIVGVSSINGQEYPPNIPGLDPDIELSTLIMNATGYISTQVIVGVSSINGEAYPPPLPEIDANLEVSTLTVNPTGYISTLAIEGVSTIKGPAGFILLDNNIAINSASGGGSLFLDSVDAVIIAGTSSELWVSSINNLSSINGAAYPPTTVIPSNLELSTLVVSGTGYVSTVSIEGLSTINGVAYPPSASVPTELTVSSLTIGSTLGLITFAPGAGGEVGAIVGLSSINGTSYPPPAGNVEDWATFPAIQDVSMASNSIYSTTTLHATYVSTNNILGSVNTAINLGQATAGAINLYHEATVGTVNIKVAGTAAPGSLVSGDISTTYLETSTINGQSVNTLNFSSIGVAQNISTPILAWDGTIARLDGGNITLAPLDNVIVRGTRTSSSIGTIEVGAIINGEAGVSTVTMDLGATTDGLLDIRTATAQILTAGSGPSQLSVASLASISSINGRAVNRPLVSSIAFGQANLPSNTGCINTDGGLIFTQTGAGNPPLVLGFSTTSPIESGVLSNEIVLIEPNAGVEGNNLNLHVSDTDISINAVAVSGGYAPARLNIRASTIHMSSLYVSSINGAAPGGSVGPDLTVSTITVNPGGFISTTTIENGGIKIDLGYGIPSSLNLVYSTNTGGRVNILEQGYGPGILNVGSLTNLSSINGAAYAGRPSVYASTSNSALTLTAVSQSTAQTVISVTVPLTEVCNLQISGSATAQTDTNSRTDIFFFVSVDDSIVGFPYADTTDGVNHYRNCSVTGTALGVTTGSKVVALKAYGESGSNYLLTPYQISVIANLA